MKVGPENATFPKILAAAGSSLGSHEQGRVIVPGYA